MSTTHTAQRPFLEQPRVSVIIPIYNSEEYLSETLDSVFAQSFQSFEIIAVDDGSPDNSKLIIDRYSNRYPGKIHYIRQENKGIAGARNTGIKHSQSEFIAFLDADDQWHPDRLLEAINLFEQSPNVALVHSDCDILFSNGKTEPIKRLDSKTPYGNIYEDLVLREATIACLTVTFKRTVCDQIGLMDENRICMGVDDRDFWIRIAKYYEVGFIPKQLATWRYHGDNYSSNIEKMFQARLHVHNKLSRKTFSDKRLYKKGLYMIYKETADRLLVKQKHTASLKKYCMAIISWPFNLWAYYGALKSLIKVKPSKSFWKSDSSPS